jgi:hypothetical protein
MRKIWISIFSYGPVFKIISVWVCTNVTRMYGDVNYNAEQLHVSVTFHDVTNFVQTQTWVGSVKSLTHLRGN